jgi:drug/metabolite transporter (DMT)-like permease
MGLDIRTPIGLMFLIIGALLAVYGVATGGDAELYRRSLDININLWWGVFLLVFGGVMFGSAKVGARKAAEAEEKP